MVKTPVNVDEEAIRSMMKEDIPRLNIPKNTKQPIEGIEDNSPSSTNESESGEEPAAMGSGEVEFTEVSIIGTTKPNRRKESKDYAALFLKKREPAQKRQTYIAASHFAKITEILAVVASDLTVPTFLDNLISDHLEKKREEINVLYTGKFKKPL